MRCKRDSSWISSVSIKHIVMQCCPPSSHMMLCTVDQLAKIGYYFSLTLKKDYVFQLKHGHDVEAEIGTVHLMNVVKKTKQKNIWESKKVS